MSDDLVRRNRLIMRQTFSIRTGPGIEIMVKASHLSAIIQALFACEEFRVLMIIFGINLPNFPIYRNIGHLFIHMVIGKEAFLIPGGILHYLFPNSQNYVRGHVDADPGLVLEVLLRNAFSEFMAVMNPAGQQHCNPELVAKVFLAYEYRCGNEHCKQPIEIRNYTRFPHYITHIRFAEHQPINIQEAVDNLTMDRYEATTKGCAHCNSLDVEVEWLKPRAMIISVDPQQNVIDIEDILIVMGEQYSLFACICRETDENIYYCYAKQDNAWCRFKGRVGCEMPALTQFQNVYLLFYKSDLPNDEFKQKFEVIESQHIIPPLDIPLEFENLTLAALQLSFNPVKYTDSDLIPKRRKMLTRQALMNIRGICFMNATIQALYHCRLFRKSILDCNEEVGPYHKHMKSLFAAMKASKAQIVDIRHEQFYQLLVHTNKPGFMGGQHNNVFCEQIIKKLGREDRAFRKGQGLEIHRESRQYKTNSDKINYANVIIGREDMSSNDAWMNFVITANDSYVFSLFGHQKMGDERCRVGHKNYLRFQHSFIDYIPIHLIEAFDSLQTIINVICSPKIHPDPTKICNECPNDTNEMYHYVVYNISRSSEILILLLAISDLNAAVPGLFINHELIVNEYLVVCGKIYRCAAFTTYITPHLNVTEAHTATCARDDNNIWWIFNDNVVTRIGSDMPTQKRINEFVSIELVFYERKMDIISMSDIASNELDLPIAMSLLDIGIDDNRLYRNPDLPIKPLSIKASTLGLTNSFGTSSYMNAALQSLYHCFMFRKYIIFDQQIWGNEQTIPTHLLLKMLFVNLSVTNLDKIDKTDFWNEFTMKHTHLANINHEYDPKLFLTFIISDLLKEGTMHAIGETVVNMFCIVYDETIYCKTVGHTKVSLTIEYVFELELIEDLKSNRNVIQSLINSNLITNLSKQVFTSCRECGINSKDSEAVMRREISRLPNLLILRLNIFDVEQDGKIIKKLVPILRVDEKIVIKDERFSFRACICCSEDTVHSFHYRAYVKCFDGMYCIDDTNITVIKKKEFKTGDIYLLFYEKI